MGKMILLLVAALTFSISTVLYSILRETSAGEGQVSFHTDNVLAREVAHTGLNEAVQQARNAFHKTGSVHLHAIRGIYQHGNYTVDIVPKGAGVQIKSVGHFNAATYTIQQEYEYLPSTGPTPPFMKGPIVSKGNIFIHDSLRVLADPLENATIHANGNLRFETNAKGYVQGFGHYGGNLELMNGQAARNIFQPNVNPTLAPVNTRVSPLSIPEFYAVRFKPQATRIEMRDIVLGGEVTLGTRAKPAIWYIEGNITTRSNVSFKGYGMLIVKGNITFDHHVQQQVSSEGSTLGLYVEGNIRMNKPALNLAGQWLLNGNLELQDHTTLSGSITTLGNIAIAKTFNVRYIKASARLIDPLWPSATTYPGEMLLLSAIEW